MANTSALEALTFSQKYREGKAVDKQRGRADETAAAKENVQWAGNALDREDYVPYLQKVYDKGIKAGRPMTKIGEALDLGRNGDLSGGKEVLRQFYRDGMRNGVVTENERTRKLAGLEPSIAERKGEAEIKYKEGETADIAVDNLREQNKVLQQQVKDMRMEQNRQARLALESGRLDVSREAEARQAIEGEEAREDRLTGLGLDTRRVEALEAGEEREVTKEEERVTEAADKRAMDKVNAQRGVRQVDRILTWVEEQGGEDWVGADAMGGWAALKVIPGTDAYQLQSMVDKIDADLFMSNIQNLRGLGHLSNIEGAKAAAAIANLDPGAGYTIFMEQIMEVKNFLELGEYRADNGITITKKGEQKQDGVVVSPTTGNESVEVPW